MLKKTRLAVLMGVLVWGGALAADATVSHAALPDGSGVVAREATEGPRGGDNERPGDRQRRGGNLTPTDSAHDQLARSKPRVPGGSGCDDPRDLIEHPECAGNSAPADDKIARSKPRVPGGSGCDDPRDLIEHPECTPGKAVQVKELV